MSVSEEERTRARLERYDGQAEGYREAALKFAQLAVTNLILINAGGLLALANGVFNLHLPTDGTATQAGVWFIAGLLAAVICAYDGYLNFGALATQQQALRAAHDWRDAKWRMTSVARERQIPFDSGDFLADGRSLLEFAAECDRIEARESARSKSLGFWINLTFGAGQVLGLVSIVCFSAACLVLVGGLPVHP